MAEQARRIKVTAHGDVQVVELTDRKILDEVNIGQINEQLQALVAGTPLPKLVVDFSGVAHMSSSALGSLITLHKRIREKGGRLCLCCIQPAIYEVFQITRLNEILKICPSRDEALSSLM